MKLNVFLFLESGTLTWLPKEVSRKKHGLKPNIPFGDPFPMINESILSLLLWTLQ